MPMIIPEIEPPFPLAWGFSTKLDDPADLPPVRLSQVHGCGIVCTSEVIQKADGLWTVQPGLRIGVRVADCAPILLAGFVEGKPWIAALHAGWRGAIAGIFREGIGLFRNLGGDLSSLVWAIGPCIQPCHFEVGEEVILAAGQDSAWHEGLASISSPGRPHLDLQGLLRAQGLSLGLDPANESSARRCTVCERELLWSYRRGDLSERQWGWIEIR
ncbi:MAG: polyphenol oxidase family protein [Acidobacteriota bacterium]|nr:polyphenol oxidase family protein [Acidobacteriota bacterium]